MVNNNYQKKGIGTKLLQLCCDGIDDVILYEAWEDKEEVNSKYLLEKCGFKLLKDLGDNYYKDNGYCMFCVNRDKECNKCKAELWIKMNFRQKFVEVLRLLKVSYKYYKLLDYGFS